MKYKFHEEVPDYKIHFSETEIQNPHAFSKEKNFIAKGAGCKVQEVVIDTDHPVGEYVIFVKGKYFGYLDSLFYKYFDQDDWEGYWGFDN